MLDDDFQKNMVFTFCKDYIEENGYSIRPADGDTRKEEFADYQAVTAESQYITEAELAEMESVIYSISFGK